MALIETSLIWVTYAVCLGILFFTAGIFVFIYQKPSERNAVVTIVCFITVFALLATVLLTPIDVALVSSTTNRKLGAKKDWATPDRVDSIVYQLKVVYYCLYSVDAFLCLLVVPFTYFWYEEYDEVAAEEGTQTIGGRLWGAFKYTIAFLALVAILLLLGFFLPVARKARDEHKDLDYFKDLLRENHGERALTFCIGILILVGTVVYCLYTAPGLALLPVKLIKTAPRVSAPQIAASTTSQLNQNRERQRQLEGRNEGREGGLDARDRRELEALIRDERTLVRRERLQREETGSEAHFFHKVWMKIEAIFRPLKLIGGLILLVIVDLLFASMVLTCIDKIKNSICGASCGYLLGKTKVLNPVNWLLWKTSKVFPIDYIIFLLITLLFFAGSVAGISSLGIRFLWVSIFKIRQGKTTPNAMLIATALLTLMAFGFNYSLTMIVAPHYATFGPQTFCDRPFHTPNEQPDCTNHKLAVRWCTERTDNKVAQMVCTPSVVSTFLNRITTNFPWMGAVDFWAQFAFLGIFLIVFIIMLFRVPRLNEEDLDDDMREEEEEGLLGSTSRRFGATWQDITGQAKGVKRADYGAVSGERAAESGTVGDGVEGDTGRDSNW